MLSTLITPPGIVLGEIGNTQEPLTFESLFNKLEELGVEVNCKLERGMFFSFNLGDFQITIRATADGIQPSRHGPSTTKYIISMPLKTPGRHSRLDIVNQSILLREGRKFGILGHENHIKSDWSNTDGKLEFPIDNNLAGLRLLCTIIQTIAETPKEQSAISAKGKQHTLDMHRDKPVELAMVPSIRCEKNECPRELIHSFLSRLPIIQERGILLRTSDDGLSIIFSYKDHAFRITPVLTPNNYITQVNIESFSRGGGCNEVFAHVGKAIARLNIIEHFEQRDKMIYVRRREIINDRFCQFFAVIDDVQEEKR